MADERINNIEPSMGKPLQCHVGDRQDQVDLSHCHISHSWLAHAVLHKGERPPECIGCLSSLTLKHVLLNYGFYGSAPTMLHLKKPDSLLTKVKQETILAFLRAADLYDL